MMASSFGSSREPLVWSCRNMTDLNVASNQPAPSDNQLAKLAGTIAGVAVLLAGGMYLTLNTPQRESAIAATSASTFNAQASAAFPASSAQDLGPLPSCENADPEVGEMLFENTCATCHGPDGRGLPHQGVNLRSSKFVAQTPDPQLVGFLRVGRQPKDTGTISGLYMPARGGNMSLDDDRLADIVAHLRALQKSESPPNAGETP
jgi:cytochrome c5